MTNISSQYSNLESFKSSKVSQKASDIKEEIKEGVKVQVSSKDPFMKWPLRGMAYTNEVGECLRPVSGMFANLSWVPVIAYVGADVADKYRHGVDNVDNPSKKRATKQLAFQALASMLLPTAAVKAGQAIANKVAMLGTTGLTLNAREHVTNAIVNSLDKGTHKKFIDEATGTIDREKYTQHILENIATKDKHVKTDSKFFGKFNKLYEALKRPFGLQPNSDKIKNYISQTVDNVMDTREDLLKGDKPKNVSKKLFNTFAEELKGNNKEGAIFSIIKKTQNNKIFKNNLLKSAGGFLALGIMMKPIDNFVENVLIERYISPTINVLGSHKFWSSVSATARDINNEANKPQHS